MMFVIEDYADDPLQLLDILHFEILAPYNLSEEPLPELPLMAVQSAFVIMAPTLYARFGDDMTIGAILLLLSELLPTGKASVMAVNAAILMLGEAISDFCEEQRDE